MEKLPEPCRFTPEEVSARWMKRYGPEFTPAYLHRLAAAGHLQIDKKIWDGYPPNMKEMPNGHLELVLDPTADLTTYWIKREERDRFEKSHPAGQSSDPRAEHISAKLALLNRAASEFWSSSTPDEPHTHSNNEAISRWLQGHGLSKNESDTGARIIRPEWARKGRPPK